MFGIAHGAPHDWYPLIGGLVWNPDGKAGKVGLLEEGQGNLEPARDRYQEAILGLEQLGHTSFASYYRASLARVYAGLGDHDEACNWLKCSVEERDPYLIGIIGDQTVASLREHPCFQEVLRKINLA